MMELIIYKDDHNKFSAWIDSDEPADGTPWPALRLTMNRHRVVIYNFQREEAQELVRALIGHWPDLEIPQSHERRCSLCAESLLRAAYCLAEDISEIVGQGPHIAGTICGQISDRVNSLLEILAALRENSDKGINWSAMPKDMLRLKKKQCNEEGSEDNGE